MPSGALNEFECTVDASINHPAHFQQSTIVDVCWQQRDSRPDSPVRCNGNDSSKAPASEEDNGGGSSGVGGIVKTNADELVKIREGFDAWLAAFRKSRPHRDVIWRVGKRQSSDT